MVVLPIGWLGLLAVLAGIVFVDPANPYPGTAALLPTVGAAALILAGDRPGSPGALLSVAPLRFLGRISYSLYLVHWPILILPAANLALGQELWLPVRVGLAGLSIVVGALSYRFVEAPFHHGGWVLRLPSRRILAAAGTCIALTMVLAVNTGIAATARLDDPNAGDLPSTASASASPGPSGVDETAAPGLPTDGPGPATRRETRCRSTRATRAEVPMARPSRATSPSTRPATTQAPRPAPATARQPSRADAPTPSSRCPPT